MQGGKKMRRMCIYFFIPLILLGISACHSSKDTICFSVQNTTDGVLVSRTILYHETPATFLDKMINPVGTTYHSHKTVEKIYTDKKEEAQLSFMPSNTRYFSFNRKIFGDDVEIVRLLVKKNEPLDVTIRSKKDVKKYKIYH